MDVALLLVLAYQLGTCASQARHHDAKQAHLGMCLPENARQTGSDAGCRLRPCSRAGRAIDK